MKNNKEETTTLLTSIKHILSFWDFFLFCFFTQCTCCAVCGGHNCSWTNNNMFDNSSNFSKKQNKTGKVQLYAKTAAFWVVFFRSSFLKKLERHLNSSNCNYQHNLRHPGAGQIVTSLKLSISIKMTVSAGGTHLLLPPGPGQTCRLWIWGGGCRQEKGTTIWELGTMWLTAKTRLYSAKVEEAPCCRTSELFTPFMEEILHLTTCYCSL